MGKENRAPIIALHKRRFRPVDIADLLKTPITTVRYAIKRFEELGTLQDRPRIGRPVTACTSNNRERIRKRIQRNPQQSMRKLGKSIGISKDSVRNMVENHLGYYPYKINKAHFLNDQMKDNRYRKVKKLRRLAAAGRHKLILFTDEKIFSIEQSHNHQIDRQMLPMGPLADHNRNFVNRSHFPQSVMVWAGICATGKTPLVFVEKGVKINAKVYQDTILKAVVNPWARNHFGNEQWTLQQDWAPAHSAKSTLKVCEELFPSFWDKEVWPSNSPDLNPLDFSVWSILEKKACSTRHDSLDSSKRALEKAWNEISASDLAAITDNFVKRLDACIAVKGNHFEHLLKKSNS